VAYRDRKEPIVARQITITIDLPEAAVVNVSGDPTTEQPAVDKDQVKPYWEFLTENQKKVFGGAAKCEVKDGPGYTLEEIADEIGETYEAVKSYHRNSGRTARVWRRDKGSEPPIGLLGMGYDQSHPGRTRYRLPEGVAEIIARLA
jgi:hypothetical protein